MAVKLERFSPSVLTRAADFMIENRRKGFPALADCIQVCNEIKARDEAALNPASSRSRKPQKRDWSDPAIAKEADAMICARENSELVRMAMTEGWLLGLWIFFAKSGRAPVGCTEEGEDERHEIKVSARAAASGLSEIERHPNGAVCEPCARSRGAKPDPAFSETWSGKCMHCGTETACTCPSEWTWPVGRFDRTANVRASVRDFREGQAKRLERIEALLSRSATGL